MFVTLTSDRRRGRITTMPDGIVTVLILGIKAERGLSPCFGETEQDQSPLSPLRGEGLEVRG
jgi:hypothetical protein